MPDVPTYVFAASGLALAVFLLAALWFKNYIKVPPNMVAVFTGRGEVQIVRGGGKFRIPGIQRVDFMGIEPFNIEVQITGALSKEGVPVSVDAVALVRFGSAEETIRTAVERFLTADREKMQAQAREIVAGNLRGIIGNMTVEELIASREDLSKRVVEEAETSFGRIGMELEVLTIQQITDERGYLEALGGKRIAEVKRDAEIGQANAVRDAMIQTAHAKREGEVAQAQAEQAISDANRIRDIQIANNQGAVAAQSAKAEQAGPLSSAQAVKDVNIAQQQAEAAKEQARIDVEAQRALAAEQAQKADTVVPATAHREAVEQEAEAAKITQVKQAEAEAQEIRLTAEANKERAFAEAAGEQAKLEAEAAGREKLAEALSKYDEIAQRLQLMPDIIERLPEMAEAVAKSMGNVDRIVLFDGGGGGPDSENQDPMSRILTYVPIALAQTIESFKAVTGVDITAIAEKNGGNGHGNGFVNAVEEDVEQ